MDANRKNSKQILDAAIDSVRATEPERHEMENGSARVWAQIGHELSRDAQDSAAGSAIGQIRSCDDYRILIPDYVAGRLSPARALLVKDHANECVDCRNALNEARGERTQSVRHAAHRFSRRTTAVFAIAAALVLGVTLQQMGYLNFILPSVEVKAMAKTIDGRLFKLAGLNMNSVSAGDTLKSGEPVRTAADSRAIIELADGTRIEMRERSQLSLTGTRDGIRVNLSRGSVIVEAAKQRNGHLYVATDDCTVSVVGTVFAVSSGVKGSRVSVLEGEVHVAQPSLEEKKLFPGQQMTTTSSLESVAIEQEISWSRNLDTYLALLRALADVNAFLRDRISGPQLRFSSTLLPLVPANTVMYAAFPNISAALGQAYDLFRTRIDQNGLLRQWWQERNAQTKQTDPTLEEMIARARSLGGYLGEEIAIAVTGSPSGPGDVIVLANVTNEAGAIAEITALMARASQHEQIRVLTDPAQLGTFTGNERGPVAYIGGSAFVLASSPRAMYNVMVAQRTGQSGFAAQPFYASISQAYTQGAGTLFAADLATLFSEAQRSEEAKAIGLTSVDRVVLEQKQVAGKTVTQAQLNFSAERSGVAAWLAPPAPMGALEFVSGQAYGVASIVTKDARTIVGEVLSFPMFRAMKNNIDDVQRETGIDIQRDLGEPLGGEFVLAMDGPFLPTPSWKVVAEVYDSARLQNSIERIVTQANIRLKSSGLPLLTLSSESIGGQVYYRLASTANLGIEVHYTFALGYVIAAPSRALVTQALQHQQNRSSIVNSAKFRSLMPADGADHCSAILYQNLTETAASIASYVPAAGGVTSDQLKTLTQTIQLTPATLVCASGEPNRIVLGYQGDLALNVLMLGGLRDMVNTLGGSRN